jgi:hypothetical protein
MTHQRDRTNTRLLTSLDGQAAVTDNALTYW